MTGCAHCSTFAIVSRNSRLSDATVDAVAFGSASYCANLARQRAKCSVQLASGELGLDSSRLQRRRPLGKDALDFLRAG
jgi:hypothetical protein